jgi:uncharacterized protein YndB with AHSA1/START domain
MAAGKLPNELRLIRVYDAPVRAVWDAWTVPEQVAKWWGPRGFTLTTHDKDFRVGGHWRYTMHGPDGVDYPNYTRYHEIEPCAKLVYEHGASAEDAPALFHVTVTFEEKQGQTSMELVMALATAAAAEETRRFIKKAGGDATWDRLAEHLGDAAGQRRFVLNRSFAAPIARVFEMWANPQHHAAWMAPKGAVMTLRGEIAAGRSVRSEVTGPHGTMYGKATHREITAPTRIVYEQQFADAQGNVARHPMAPTWPETMLTTVTFAEEGPDETRVTIVWEPLGATDAELATFLGARPNITMGWTASLDGLEDALRG